MLVVLSILALLAALIVPALKNLGKANLTTGATSQLLGDVGYARQLAIANHTTVYMVFIPTNFWNNPAYNDPVSSAKWLNAVSSVQQWAIAATNFADKQVNGYIYMAYGAVGDQPGNHRWHYLDIPRSLPDGTFIPLWKFVPPGYTNYITDMASRWTYQVGGFNTNSVPFPTETSPLLNMPCIAFNYLGQLTTAPPQSPNPETQDEYIPLARGSVMPGIDPVSRALQFTPPAISEVPPGNSTNSAYNIVQIDWLTGRATLRFQNVQ